MVLLLIFTATLFAMAVLAKNSSQYKTHALYGGAILFFIAVCFQGGAPLQTIMHEHDGHSSAHHIWELLMLFTGFGIIAKLVDISGFDYLIAKQFAAHPRRLNWVLFWLSSFLDNILVALIGSKVLSKSNSATERSLSATVAAANLGGSFSPIGDTTTIMIAISLAVEYSTVKVLAFILPAIIAALPAMWYLTNKLLPEEVEEILIEEEPTSKTGLLQIAISVLGLLIGGLFFNAPGYGLWVWIGIAYFLKPLGAKEIMKIIFHELKGSWLMVATLISMAANLPLDTIKDITGIYGEVPQIFGIGMLSAVFDNIPLTSLMILIGVKSWGLLAYAVGYGGSMTWFGSSAGIAVSHQNGCESIQQMSPATQWVLLKAYVIGFATLVVATFLYAWLT